MLKRRIWLLLVALGLLPGLAALAVVSGREIGAAPAGLVRRVEPIPLDPGEYHPPREPRRPAAPAAPAPRPVDRRTALGVVPEAQRALLEDERGFEPMPPAQPGDWLFRFPEVGETFEEYRAGHPNRPGPERRTLYLQPLIYESGGLRDPYPDLDLLAAYAAAFYGLPAATLPPLDASRLGVRTRQGDLRQLRTDDILAALARRVPDDAHCLIAVTLEDLYPDGAWNYVFGMASLRQRVGVYSLVRFDPALYGSDAGLGRRGIILRRSWSVLSHELGHMFGLAHCPYYRCLMNGSNSLAEMDGAPLHLCPVCLRKLTWNTGQDPAAPYRGLETFYRARGVLDEAEWIRARLAAAPPVLPSRR